MPLQFPSDKLKIPGAEDLNVGSAREFLENYVPDRPEDAELLVIAQGLRGLLHDAVDRTRNGAEILLPEEIARRNAAVSSLIEQPAVHFPAEG